MVWENKFEKALIALNEEFCTGATSTNYTVIELQDIVNACNVLSDRCKRVIELRLDTVYQEQRNNLLEEMRNNHGKH